MVVGMEGADSTLDDHSRTIIHIDADCFYAQVEIIKNPELKTVPFAVNQKNYIVTSNYVAREYGLKKMMLVKDAKKVCPNLRLINGEDLHDYRQISYKVTELIQNSFEMVERLALDENFIDVSKEVQNRLENTKNIEIAGNIYGDISDLCDCGCTERLKMGTVIAQEIRDKIECELKLTTCAGIAHNKLLAKLVGGIHRPKQQTVIFPNNAVDLMLSLNSLSKIPGMGAKSLEQLSTINVNSVDDLHKCDFTQLSGLLGHERAQTLYNFSFGLDHSIVKTSGKPQSIGIEDCKPLFSNREVDDKLKELLNRLMILIEEDGRIPSTIKLTVRKVDNITKQGIRQTRQCNVNPEFFKCENISKLSEHTMNSIMRIIEQLFKKLVDTSKHYHLTLLGVAFTKFQERTTTKTTLTKFLEKKVETHCHQDKFHSNKTVKKSITPMNNSKSTKTAITKRSIDQLIDNTSNSNAYVDGDKCPPEVDEAVFRELPLEIQNEIWADRDMISQKKAKKPRANSILNYLDKR